MLDDAKLETGRRDGRKHGKDDQHKNKNRRTALQERLLARGTALYTNGTTTSRLNKDMYGPTGQKTTTKKDQQETVHVPENCQLSKTFFSATWENQKDIPLPTPVHGRAPGRRRQGTMLVQFSAAWKLEACEVRFLQDALRHGFHKPTIETIESRAQDTGEASTNSQLMQTMHTQSMMSTACPDGVVHARPRTEGFRETPCGVQSVRPHLSTPGGCMGVQARGGPHARNVRTRGAVT